ncbi:MAG TPA: hypothetical protein VFQ09_06625 [Rubrobacter sp.]|nr:hypothetical protein [Rubrobacter sp.]
MAASNRSRGYRTKLNFALDNLGWAALLQGNHEQARTSYSESLMVSNELGNKMNASENALAPLQRRELYKSLDLMVVANRDKSLTLKWFVDVDLEVIRCQEEER